jgi:deoxyadenosine/deoxycytidine kinase
LSDLNEHYAEFTTNYKEGKLLVLDVNDLDFVNNPKDLAKIIAKIDKALLYDKQPELEFEN